MIFNLISIFFSIAQKYLNSPNKVPTIINKICKRGKINKILINQKTDY